MMNRVIGIVLVALAFALLVVTRGVAAQDSPFLAVGQDPTVGAFLTDAEGMTLYLFTPDTTPGESACYDQCAENWPPLTPGDDMTLPTGVPGDLSTIERTDGTQQVAYNDIPLYYFAQDQAAGDIVGQAVGGVWFVVPPGSSLGAYAPAPGEGTPVPAAAAQIGFTGDLGPYLTDAEGRTVYLFTNDTVAGESACYDDCAENWPPVPAADSLVLPPGIQGTLAALERTDGSPQMTYNDIPLYFFAEDAAPGDTNGQERGDVWYVVTPGMQFGDAPHEAAETEAEAESGTPVSS
ncbi:MAG: hypothetical protein ACRDJC_10140 [Thermomicrobiales bacterium]